MKKHNTILKLTLAALLIAALTSCASKQDSTPPDATSQAAQPPTASASSAAEQEKPAMNNFTTTDIDGNEVTQAIFADYDLTMINIWATFCGPCLTEMPDLGKLSAEYKDQGVQIVGIVMDVLNRDGTYSDEMVEVAKDVIAKTGANYPHLMPSPDLMKAKLMDVVGVPETIFVDRDGNIVGESYVGMRDKATWEKIIEATLAEVK